MPVYPILFWMGRRVAFMPSSRMISEDDGIPEQTSSRVTWPKTAAPRTGSESTSHSTFLPRMMSRKVSAATGSASASVMMICVFLGGQVLVTSCGMSVEKAAGAWHPLANATPPILTQSAAPALWEALAVALRPPRLLAARVASGGRHPSHSGDVVRRASPTILVLGRCALVGVSRPESLPWCQRLAKPVRSVKVCVPPYVGLLALPEDGADFASA